MAATMDHESLRTAATYLNNLLLARGLLRDSEPVDFVKPSRDSRAQIINLVHDLILRDDQSATQREQVALTLRSLRQTAAQHTQTIARLSTQCEDAARQTAAAQAAERVAQNDVKRVERASKALQEQVGKMKTALSQVRAQCASDLRKRDGELARLKGHLQGQQRGSRGGAVPASLVLAKKGMGNAVSRQRGNEGSVSREVGNPEYSLRQETTEFLTQLSQNLSDENDGLVGLVRSSLGTMRELLGLPVSEERKPPDSAMGSMNSSSSDTRVAVKPNNVLCSLPLSFNTMASDMHATLEQLKEVLTNPNFVSVEEVEEREEEIAHLREGWDRMETRWRDVLGMMEDWRARMNTGEAINMEDLRRGLVLVSPNDPRERIPADMKFKRPRRSRSTHQRDVDSSEISESLPTPSLRRGSRAVDASIGDISLASIGSAVGAGATTVMSGTNAHTATPATSARLSLPQPDASRENGGRSPKRKHDVLEPPEMFDLRPSVTTRRNKTSRSTAVPETETADELDYQNDNMNEDDSEEATPDKEGEAHMTVAEKLNATRAEADQARAEMAAHKPTATTRSNAHPARSTQPRVSATRTHRADDDDTLGQMVQPAVLNKKIKIRGRPRKRKSTLSPEELEALIAAEE